VLRVFARGEEGGNHLGIVVDAGDLDSDAMQAVATRLTYSETIFLQRDDTCALIRIFTPGAEIPFAGHPLVGAAWMMGRLGAPSGRIACGIGFVEYRTDEDEAWVDVPLTAPVVPAPLEEAAVAGVQAVRAWWVDLPFRYLVAEVSSAEAVSGAEADMDRLSAAAWSGTYVFARNDDRVKARFFAPGLGVPEDPATGSAAVALAAVMVHAEDRSEGRMVVEQGDEIGAPCRIELTGSKDVVTLGGTVRDDGIRRLGL